MVIDPSDNNTPLQKTVILNASPTILLAKAGIIHLLSKLFAFVIIPKEVFDEVNRKTVEELVVIQQLIHTGQITITKERTELPDLMTSERLGGGELAVLSLAQKFIADEKKEVIVILDDKPARNLAFMLGIKVLGSLGVLILAKKRKILDYQSAIESLNHLLQYGGYFDPLLIEQTRLALKS